MKLAIVLLVAACSRRPCPKAPDPAVIVAPRPACDLPDLPYPIEPKIIG